MGIEILHVRSNGTLQDTSSRVFEALGITEYTPHDSDNHPGSLYFQGTLGEHRIKVAQEDDLAYSEYQYWVVIKTPSSHSNLAPEMLTTLVKALLNHGFKVCRELKAAPGTSRREIYNSQSGGGLETMVESTRT
jgi:hypothetical protein